MKIQKEKLIPLQNVHLDTIGNVYEYDGKIIRIINKNSVRHVNKLMNSGLVERLVEKGFLVDTKVSEYTAGEGELVLEHKRIEPYSHVSQWSFEMMKSAAIMVLNMIMICAEYGYALKDCHQDNILFDGVNPIYIDFGSITKANVSSKESSSNWISKQEFLRCYYYPLKLYTKGYFCTVTALMKSGKDLNEMRRIYYAGIPSKVIEICGMMASLKRKTLKTQVHFFIAEIERLHLDYKTYWGKYQDSYWNKEINERFAYEIERIKTMPDIETVVEVGANQGIFAFFVSKMTKVNKIIATDYDVQAVDNMYIKLKGYKDRKNNITPLVLDFVNVPIETLKKYQCNLVVANALTHHLLLSQKLDVNVLVDRLSALTDRYVMVEFMPRGVNGKVPSYYTLDWFWEHMRYHFEIISVDRMIENRILIVGKKLATQ